MLRRTAFLAALLSLSPPSALASSLDRLSEFINKTLAAEGKFEQKIFDRNRRLLQESEGTLAFSRPGKFRWTYAKPYPQLIVGDGTKVWIYDEDLNQVTVKKLDLALGSTPAALLAGNNEAMGAFRLSDLGAKGGLEWLEALPRNREGNFETIRMGFGSSGLEVMELADSFGQTTVLKFTSLLRNPNLDLRLFRFSPPKGADVVGDVQ
ncbi:MAG TPA: outer membrane lipoprotein chaperone LolA [Burkholderiales bacterium]|jgi:outer membrane lipoprotein carrier protein